MCSLAKCFSESLELFPFVLLRYIVQLLPKYVVMEVFMSI